MLLRMMMAASSGPVIVPTNRLSVTWTRFVSFTTSHPVQMPAEVNAGDLLLVQLGIGSNSGTMATPSGWTLVANNTTEPLAADPRVTDWIFKKQADGSEGGTTVDFVTSTGEAMIAAVHRIEAGTYGFENIATWHTTNNEVAGTTTATPDPPAIPVPWGDTENTFIAMSAHEFRNTYVGYPDGYSEGAYDWATDATDGTVGIYACTMASAIRTATGASEDAGNFTIETSRNWVSRVVAIGPGGLPALDSPVVLEHLSQYFSTDAVSHLVNMPAVVNAGDRLILLMSNHATATVNTPSGWTKLSQDTGGTVMTFTIFYKDASGSEGGTTVDFTTTAGEKAGTVLYRIQAGTFDPSAAPEVGPVNSGVSAAPSATPVNPSWGVADTLFIAAVGADNRRGFAVGSSAFVSVVGYESEPILAVPASTLSTAAQVYTAWGRRRYSASWPAQFRISGSQTWRARTIAIKPAP